MWHPPSPNPPYYQYPGRQLGLVPVEWHSATWQAIRNAVAYAGVTVVEAAGNGNEDLDHPDYATGHHPFLDDPGSDSGAIIVGAGASPASWMADRSRLSNLSTLGYEWGSNFGSRVDAQGWGDGIVTTGYGDLPLSGGGNENYTQFGGTSGASPCIAGACAIVARYKQRFERRSTRWSCAARRAAAAAVQTSDVHPASEHIGKRPDVMKIFADAGLYDPIDFARGFEAPIGGSAPTTTTSARWPCSTTTRKRPNPPALFVGGEFTMAGGVPANNIASGTGSGWEDFGTGVSFGTPWQYNGSVRR